MKLLLLSCFALFVFSTGAFSQATDGSLTYNKKKQQAIVIDYGYPQEAVENALIDKIEKMGYKAREEKGLFNKDKGLIVFKNASLPDITSKTMDYIIKIERKSRKEKDETTLTLAMEDKGGGTIAEMDAFDVGKAKSFLNNLLPEIEEANLELQIKAQEDVVVKSEKKYKDLQDDQSSLEKKIKNLQDDLKTNGQDQVNQQKDIEAQKKALDLLKGRRKGAAPAL
ncbi:MAG: hypothetical protein WDN26_18710 [Chitinophagaceae bacterium]